MNAQTLPLSEILTSVQFVTVAQDRQMAVVDADEWNQLMEWLEDIEDERIIQDAAERLRAGPKASGAIPLEEALNEL